MLKTYSGCPIRSGNWCWLKCPFFFYSSTIPHMLIFRALFSVAYLINIRRKFLCISCWKFKYVQMTIVFNCLKMTNLSPDIEDLDICTRPTVILLTFWKHFQVILFKAPNEKNMEWSESLELHFGSRKQQNYFGLFNLVQIRIVVLNIPDLFKQHTEKIAGGIFETFCVQISLELELKQPHLD